MTDNSPKILTGMIAVAIYMAIVGLLVFYFNTKNSEIPKKFVKKNDNRIQVSIAAPKKIIPKNQTLPSVNQKTHKSSKPKKVIHKESNKKIIKDKVVKKVVKKVTKKEIKKKIIKKPTKKKEVKTKPKIIKKVVKTKAKKTSDLFSTIKTTSKPIKKVQKPKKTVKTAPPPIKHKPSASERISNALKVQKRKDKGIQNTYFSKVQSLLETWPAQSDYAGEKAIVRISVKPTGMFTFSVKSQSNNPLFNTELIAFLKQLQRIGLGRHNAGRAYEFDVEFIAKE